MRYSRLKDLREDHDYSQLDIAEYLHRSQSDNSRIENGRQDIPKFSLKNQLYYMAFSTDYLLNMDKPF